MKGAPISHAFRASPALIDQLVQKRSGSPVLTTTKQFDKLNRLSGISSVSSVPSVVNSASYGFNSANQRTRLTEADGKFWDFGYDVFGQVTAGVKKLADTAPVLGHSFGYSFDTIGNLKTTAVNGQSATYAPDAAGLNQYASRTVPAVLDIIGTADAGAKVAVNLAPAQRQGDLFYKQLPVTNTSSAKWQPIDVLAGKTGAGVGGADADTRQSGHLFLAKTPESFTYDLDGNLTGDGLWSYAWDAENRLTTMETVAAAVTAGVPKQKLEFVYDFTGRRIQKKVSGWNGTAYILASDTRFLYDGWNLLAEFNALSSNAVVRSYVWGIDLSGTAQGAGGVGGLLAIHQPSSIAHLPCYDGNGNVTGLIDSTTGARSATYTYGPFGEPIAAYGPAAAANPFRFSTKYTDAETGQLYYGYRYYNPSTKRWLSRDPIEEKGGANLYGMLDNDAVNSVDLFGLKKLSKSEGELSLRAGLAMLETACDSGCKPGFLGKKRCCTPEECKKDAKAIIDALVGAWNRNYGNGPHSDARGSDTVGGYFCWDWANIFNDAIQKLDPNCVSYEQGIAAAPVETVTTWYGLPEKVTPVHWYLKVYACKRESSKFRVNFDDGFFDGENASHPGAFPQKTKYNESDSANYSKPRYSPFTPAPSTAPTPTP